MTAALDEVDEGQLSWDRSLNGKRWLMALGALVLFGFSA